jgi:hypothetical protein
MGYLINLMHSHPYICLETAADPDQLKTNQVAVHRTVKDLTPENLKKVIDKVEAEVSQWKRFHINYA